MRKISLLCATLVCALLFGGCPASTDQEVTPEAATFRCKIDGIQYSNPAASALIQSGRLVLNGIGANNKGIMLQADETVARVKSYSLLNGSANTGIYNPGGGASTFLSAAAGATGANNGTFAITSVDATNKKMSGTFFFTAKGGVSGNTVTVTEGSFSNVPYVVEPTQPANNNVFTYSVNGTAQTVTEVWGSLLGGPLSLSGTTSATNVYKTISMSLNADQAVGVINAAASWGQVFRYQEGTSLTNGITYLAVTGNTVTITSHDTAAKRIKGSFNCPNMTNTVNTTKRSVVGSFDITYQ
jgi:Family of unknown function (DUF6252)